MKERRGRKDVRKDEKRNEMEEAIKRAMTSSLFPLSPRPPQKKSLLLLQQNEQDLNI